MPKEKEATKIEQQEQPIIEAESLDLDTASDAVISPVEPVQKTKELNLRHGQVVVKHIASGREIIVSEKHIGRVFKPEEWQVVDGKKK